MGRRLVPAILLTILTWFALPGAALADAVSAERVSAWLADRAAAHLARMPEAARVGDAVATGCEPFRDDALVRDVEAVYKKNRGRLLFVNGAVLSPAGDTVAALVADVERHGVGGQAYEIATLDGRLRRYRASLQSVQRPRASWVAPPDWVAPKRADKLPRGLEESLERTLAAAERHVEVARELDVHLTAALTRLVADLGLADGSGQGDRVRAVIALARDPDGGLAARLPDHPQYRALTEAMGRYLALWRGPDPPTVPQDVPIVQGDRSPAVGLLRARLAWEGFLPESGPAIFDPDTIAALERFQRSRGLPDTGLADGPTRVALNRPASWWVRRLVHALGRWRVSETRTIGATYVRVNIPEFALEVREDGERALTMPVLVGQPQTPTHALTSTLKEIRVNPRWNVPKGVQRREIEPRAARDPEFLEREHIVKRGPDGRERYIQLPGPWNWLGRAIIPFFNRHGLALHGTLRDHLMGDAQRAFSNGCVNLADEIAFVRYLLEREGNKALGELDGWLEGWKTHRIRLRRAIPLVIEYQTVVVDDDGLVRFLPDIYRMEGASLSGTTLDAFVQPAGSVPPRM